MQTVVLKKPFKIDGKELKEIKLKLEELTGEDILKVDRELKEEGYARGFDNVLNQIVLLKVASKASGILEDDLKKLSAPDFLELTYTVSNFLAGLSDLTEEPKSSGKS